MDEAITSSFATHPACSCSVSKFLLRSDMMTDGVSKHGLWLNSYKPEDRSGLGGRQRQGSRRGALSSLYAPPPPVRLLPLRLAIAFT